MLLFVICIHVYAKKAIFKRHINKETPTEITKQTETKKNMIVEKEWNEKDVRI